MTFSDLEKVFVSPFEPNDRRKALLSRLEAFATRLQEIPIDMEIWIDGSFATKKENPGDIDLVVVCAADDVNKLPQEKKLILEELFANKSHTKLRYECDAYFILDNFHDKSYWRGLFGFDRNEIPKGIARLRMVA
ncbi:hypothetical protein SBW85_03270 [Vibrio plantisponsor]|uniref:Polymerase nucleotidyl transferase domain-containing protein n=2 Tax=Vibrio plantisponsor TaxID=664643 RepID=A0ABU4IF56_9VIBR|nr:hypothetical protein [Vibrio plantisponsor]MDW6016789.1 hypothetical protein [Vibrio plantisponsor]NNM39840.1 hypothetical protein [Vibrio plantisponsor]